MTAGLRGCEGPLAAGFDVGLYDLDGVVNLGDDPVPHAAESVAAAAGLGLRPAYVTNNALRTPDEVAARLTRLGVHAEPTEVVTSAQAAARVVAEKVDPGSAVLVAGGEGLRAALRALGLVPVGAAADGPAAVVTGHDPEQTWARLAEATLALRQGVLWVASNTDATFPDKRGLLPGAGAVVALLATASDRRPDAIAGKPHPALHRESVLRTGAQRPLIVGDRLDTDIEGAHNGGVPGLLVFTGVTDPRGLLDAPPHQRPDFVAADLRGLLEPHPAVRAEGDSCTVRNAQARLEGGTLHVGGEGREDRWRAAAVLAWSLADAGRGVTEVEGLPER